MRLHPRTQVASVARSTFVADALRLLYDSNMTDIEAAQAVNELQATLLKSMLRRERHPHHECKADEACDRKTCPGSR
jgi:hypothetical protein